MNDDIKKLAEAMSDDDVEIVPVEEPEPPAIIEKVETKQADEPTPKKRERGNKGTSLKSLLPAIERVRIWKRRNNGRTSYIGEYGGRDLERKGSIEVFLHEYVMPKWGTPGQNDFLIYLVKADGQQLDAGEVTIEGSPEPVSKETSTLEELIELQKKMAHEATAKSDPVDQMMKMMALQKEMSKGGGMDPMMMFFMMQQMNQPKTPSATEALLERLVRKIDSMEHDREIPMMPSPFPMPAPDPAHGVLEAISKIAEIMKPSNTQQTPMELISLIKALAPTDAIGAKDILPMLNTMKDLTRPPDKNYIRETLESLEMLRKAKDILEPAQEGGTFWDFLRDMVSPDNVGALRDMVGQIRAKEAPQQIPVQVVQQKFDGAPSKSAVAASKKATPEHFDEFPKGFEVHSKRIEDAKDAAASVEATMVALNSLPRMAPYQPFVDGLIGLALQSETDDTKKEPALDYVQTFLESMLGLDMISQEKADQAINAFEEHWAEIVSTLKTLISQAQAAAAGNKQEFKPENKKPQKAPEPTPVAS